MKFFIYIICLCLHLCLAGSLRCFNCFIDGPLPFYFLKPLDSVYSRCSGVQDDFANCDGGICSEVMLYGNDIARYQVLRACSFNPEVCSNLEIGNNVHVGKCRTCATDCCNNIFE